MFSTMIMTTGCHFGWICVCVNVPFIIRIWNDYMSAEKTPRNHWFYRVVRHTDYSILLYIWMVLSFSFYDWLHSWIIVVTNSGSGFNAFWVNRSPPLPGQAAGSFQFKNEHKNFVSGINYRAKIIYLRKRFCIFVSATRSSRGLQETKNKSTFFNLENIRHFRVNGSGTRRRTPRAKLDLTLSCI